MSSISGALLYSLTIQFLIVRIEKLAGTAFMLRALRGKVEWGKDDPKILAFDGKTSRGSKRNKTDKDAEKAMHTVSVLSTDHGLCIAEAVVDEKTNEIPTVQAMLETINVKGYTVTFDALNTQIDTIAAIIKGGGDYVAPVKGNHPEFYKELELYFEDESIISGLRTEETKDGCYRVTCDKEQSGIARREYYLSDEIWWIHMERRTQWAGLKRIGCAKRTLTKTVGNQTVETVETRYFITSVTSVDDFAKAVRGHWGIENNIHWALDYTFHDDQNTTMAKHGAQNLQTMKRVSLAILGMVQTFFGGISIKNIRYSLALDFNSGIETIFKLLNDEELSPLLLPRTG
jgi:predicted transposase YbfD/YdcC